MKRKLIALAVALLLLVTAFSPAAKAAVRPAEPAAGAAKQEFAALAKTEAPKKTEAEKKKDDSAAKTPAEGETRIFIDSVGREVTVPKEITRIAPSGPLAQVVLYTAVPDKLAGVARAFSPSQIAYFPEKFHDLPEFGQFFGGNATLNMETLIAESPDVIIDIGEAKGSMKEDMDGLQEQLKIPTVFIEATLPHMPEAYEKLAKLVGEEERLQTLADYIRDVLDKAEKIREELKEEDKVRVYWAMGDAGLNTNAAGSFQEEVLQIVGAVNVADVEPVSRGGGSEVSLEQLIIWQPDLIIFSNQKLAEEKMADTAWQALDAIKDDKIVIAPSEPYGVLDSPPSVNRILGIIWLGQTLYPEQYDVDLKEAFTEFYKLFYSADITDEQMTRLLGK